MYSGLFFKKEGKYTANIQHLLNGILNYMMLKRI